jgi:hypothetical protein
MNLLESDLKNLENNFYDEINTKTQISDNDIIYHYTNAEGLKGIIESNSFYATQYNFLSDPTEITYVINIIKNEIEKIVKPNMDNNIFQELNKLFDFKLYFDDLLSVFINDIYLVCFSAGGDQLSQWRGYGANGEGYAIGIKTEYLKKNIPVTRGISLNPEFSLLEISYNENELHALIEKYSIKFIEILEKTNDEKILTEKYNILLEMLDELVFLYKNPSFKEENEWRFVHHTEVKKDNTTDNILFRCINKINKPFAKIDIKPDSIKEIIIGPKLNEKKSMLVLEQLLIKNNYSNVKISKSKIPCA